MRCVEFAEAKGGCRPIDALLNLPWGLASPLDSHRNSVGRHEDLPADATQQRRIRANLFHGEQDWQGTLFEVDTEQYPCHSVYKQNYKPMVAQHQLSEKDNNELPNLPHGTTKYPCRIRSRHLSSLYRPLGHFDKITILLHVCRSLASLIRAMLLVIVHSAISEGQVLPIFPRSLPTYRASWHVTNEAS